MYMRWTSDLETGNRQIDLQHYELIDLINETYAAISGGGDNEQIADVLDRLRAYVMFHFSHEDKLMDSKSVDQALARAHRAAHDEFSQHFDQLRVRLSNREAVNLEDDLLEYLKSWLIRHIQHTDKELVRALRKGYHHDHHL